MDHQIDTLLELTRARQGKMAPARVSELQTKADTWRARIRDLYSNLLFEDHVSIYSESLRVEFYKPSISTGIRLSVGDFENLIVFEFSNNKFDLANKWFDRFDQEFNMDQYTPKMWDIRFKINGGDPRLWKVYENDVFIVNTNVAHSYYKRMPLSQLLNSFLKHNKLESQIENIILCLGYYRKVDSIYQLIHEIYGVDVSGEKVPNKIISDTNISIGVLNSIVIALSYNHRYFESMKFINAFQSHASVYLESQEAGFFWGNLLKWTDLTTKFNKKMVLDYYIKNINPQAKHSTLPDLMNDVNFDYERYLQFTEDLIQKRVNIMRQIWSLFQSSNGRFSVVAYKTYWNFLKRSGTEQEVFEFLELLNSHNYQFSVTRGSFNFKYLGLNNTLWSIQSLYYQAIKWMIEAKLNNQLVGQVQPLINEWCLDYQMRAEATQFFKTRLPKLAKKIEEKREQEMIKQRQDDEPFLELF
ncbi:hypothetical protein CANTEDRAFT_113883 [Yamadazyma tenuis ATCC 10573]|uniref:ATPase expression protein 2, mitochondrial n=2 Tax=Candida tenuis TaxID=2315449 RepID=G3B4S1_CANTC|nr:uncharacterized protein CANTEDRAFT_113883 [Yamadazyma tenuis ATCC 10573]EGV63857.1 hypothetical protein CANTEDRAFT_113883 [Yamadazyma tenuis ATCC 10573]